MARYVADRQGNLTENSSSQDRILEKLYGSIGGRMILRPLVSPWFSKFGGKVLDSRISAIVVPGFIRKHRISMKDYEPRYYHSYNDFFTRKIRSEARMIDRKGEHFISPCDSRLSVYPIDESSCVTIKHTPYTVASLLNNHTLAQEYQGGYLWVFRLSVEDYHHYIYVDDGNESARVRIPGVFHTVNPVANDVYPIYKKNTREYSVLNSDHFGEVLMMEVGALLVGKIENHPITEGVYRGQEKGKFAFGGSTIVLMTKKNRVLPDEDIRMRSRKGIETRVRMGEKVGIGNLKVEE